MKKISESTLNWAAHRFYELVELGVIECEDRYDNDISGYLPDDVQFFSGASRMCFQFDEIADWIIKVDFSYQKGYCKKELENYRDAVTAGLDEYFAATYKLTELDDGRIVIIQEAATVDEEAVSSTWNEYAMNDDYYSDEDKADPCYLECYMYDMDDCGRLYATLGDIKNFNELDEFCMNHQINDLHENNWGINDKGAFIIIDFAGYGIL